MPSRSRQARAASAQRATSTLAHTSMPGIRWVSSRPSPRTSANVVSSAWRASSVGGASTTGASASLDDKGLTPSTLRHVLVLDALLEQHDALEQGLRAGR